jgi:hypothetical protein
VQIAALILGTLVTGRDVVASPEQARYGIELWSAISQEHVRDVAKLGVRAQDQCLDVVALQQLGCHDYNLLNNASRPRRVQRTPECFPIAV